MLAWLQSCWKADHARRILWLPVIYGSGIGCYFVLSSEPDKWITLAVIETLILTAIIFRRRMRVLYYLSVAAMFVLGFATAQLKTIYVDSSSADIYNRTSYFKGVITDIDTNYKGRPRFTFNGLEDFDGNLYQGQYRMVQRSNSQPVAIGDCVEMVGTILPSARETMVGAYQLDRKNYFSRLKGSGYAESSFYPAECSGQSTNFFASVISGIRNKLVKHITAVLPSSEAAIASAIIAGNKNLITPSQYEQYRNSGLAHFLAISGLHMSLLSGLMFFVVRFILALIPGISLRLDSRKIAAVFALIIGLIYLFISGMAIPAQRAFIMISIVLLGIMVNRRALSMYSVALAAFIILLLAPEVLVSASFQMSFAAVVGLIAFYERYSAAIHAYFNRGNHLWRGFKLYIFGILITDFIASLSTLPFAVYHFNMVAIYTTLGNLLAGPIIGFIIMPGVLLSLLFMPLGLDKPFLLLSGYGINLVNHITEFVSALPYADFYVPSMPLIGLLSITLGGLWLAIWQCKWRWWGACAIILGFLSIAFIKVPDILVGENMKAIAFKNADGRLELVSTRGGDFIKQAWQQKYPFSARLTTIKSHPEFEREGDIITIGNQQYNIKEIIGLSAYRNGDDFDVYTIRDDIGLRPWNKNN